MGDWKVAVGTSGRSADAAVAFPLAAALHVPKPPSPLRALSLGCVREPYAVAHVTAPRYTTHVGTEEDGGGASPRS